MRGEISFFPTSRPCTKFPTFSRFPKPAGNPVHVNKCDACSKTTHHYRNIYQCTEYLPTNLHFLNSSRCVQNMSPGSFGMCCTNSGCVMAHSCSPLRLNVSVFTLANLNSLTAHWIQCLTWSSLQSEGSAEYCHI